MIAVDSSALLAIIFDEPERNAFRGVLNLATKALISPVSIIESKIVAHGRRGQKAVILLDSFLNLPIFEIAPPGKAEIEAAYGAFVTFGKGSGHPAGLNFGDVFSYALAKVRNLPLLYKGSDFRHTDLRSALAGPLQ